MIPNSRIKNRGAQIRLGPLGWNYNNEKIPSYPRPSPYFSGTTGIKEDLILSWLVLSADLSEQLRNEKNHNKALFSYRFGGKNSRHSDVASSRKIHLLTENGKNTILPRK